jgi:hypothetical protein
MSPTGLEPEKNWAGEVQKQLQATDPTPRQRERPTPTNPQLSKDN